MTGGAPGPNRALPGTASPSAKRYRRGTHRALPPEETWARVAPLAHVAGVTRVAVLTGLDRVGIPVASAARPNSRSLAVSQGKGASPVAAKVSALMESLECHVAERFAGPLLWSTPGELARGHRLADLDRLPRAAARPVHAHHPLLWTRAWDLLEGAPGAAAAGAAGRGEVWVPYEAVHLNFTLPLPAGSGSFLMTSNGLASGNTYEEAVSHGLCELVERDANTLWGLSSEEAQALRRVRTETVDDEVCRWALDRFEAAGVEVLVWDTTSDVGLPSFLCTVADREENPWNPVPVVSGSGCHPRREIALARALTEAAQGRITVFAGVRDDLGEGLYGGDELASRRRTFRRRQHRVAARAFSEVPTSLGETFAADLRDILERLRAVGCPQVLVVDLLGESLGAWGAGEPSAWDHISVVRVLVPGLESMHEVPGWIPGARARAVMERRASGANE